MNYKENCDLLKPFSRGGIISKPTKGVYDFYFRACNQKFSEKIIPIFGSIPGCQSLFLQILGMRLLLVGQQTKAFGKRVSILHELGHAGQKDGILSNQIVDTLKANPTKKNLGKFFRVLEYELDAWHWARSRAKDIRFLTKENIWRWNIIETMALKSYRKVSRHFIKKMNLIENRYVMGKYRLLDPEWVKTIKGKHV